MSEGNIFVYDEVTTTYIYICGPPGRLIAFSLRGYFIIPFVTKIIRTGVNLHNSKFRLAVNFMKVTS